jgi:hypothetical protein
MFGNPRGGAGEHMCNAKNIEFDVKQREQIELNNLAKTLLWDMCTKEMQEIAFSRAESSKRSSEDAMMKYLKDMGSSK